MNDKTQTIKEDVDINIDDALLVGAMLNTKNLLSYGVPYEALEIDRNKQQDIRNTGRMNRHEMNVWRIASGDVSGIELYFPEVGG